jgi:ABC-2 type transport system permease protein
VFGFGLWHNTNFESAAIILLLGGVTFGALGVLSASFTLVLKQGDPIIPAYAAISVVFGGLLFPVTMLPEWLQPLANLVPLSHALTGMRLALGGAPVTELVPQIFALSAMSAMFVPACVIAFKRAIDRAKMEGSLVQY